MTGLVAAIVEEMKQFQKMVEDSPTTFGLYQEAILKVEEREEEGGVIMFACDDLHLRNERRGVCRIERRVLEMRELNELVVLAVGREAMRRNDFSDVDDGNDESIVMVGLFGGIFPYSRRKR